MSRVNAVSRWQFAGGVSVSQGKPVDASGRRRGVSRSEMGLVDAARRREVSNPL